MNRQDHEDYIRSTLKRFVRNMPTIRSAVGDPARIDDFLGRLETQTVTWRGIELNLEIYRSAADDPVLIFHGGIGVYARFYLCFLSLLCERGFNIVAVDRPGHGFSGGKRGDCSVGDVAEFIPLLIERAGNLFNDRIGMFGSSLGGITTFYLLPDLKGVCSALCHNWLYPGEPVDPKRPWLPALARLVCRIAPRLDVPMGMLLDRNMMDALSESHFMVDYFRKYKQDPVYCKTLTLRSVVSYFGDYRPIGAYSDVTIPVMGLIAENDGMLPIALSRRWWEMAGLKQGELRIVPNAQHMLFNDNMEESLDIVADWFRRTIP